MPAAHRLIALLALLAPQICNACDYCLLGQGISRLQTQTGAGIRVSPLVRAALRRRPR